jgi:type II secretory pathway pseudopilin PulG
MTQTQEQVRQPSTKHHGRRPRGFSLAEALVAITILAMAGVVLLLSVESSLQTTTSAIDRSIADGLAQQLLDEITLKHFVVPGSSPTSTSFGPNAYETAGQGRERYNDTDDYYNLTTESLEGVWGEPLGTGDDYGGQRHSAFQIPASTFAGWRQRVQVYFVDPTDHRQPLATGTSSYRGIEVHIERAQADGSVHPLATRKRIIAYFPPPSY